MSKYDKNVIGFIILNEVNYLSVKCSKNADLLILKGVTLKNRYFFLFESVLQPIFSTHFLNKRLSEPLI